MGLQAARERGSRIGQAPYGTRWREGALQPVDSELAVLQRAQALKRRLRHWTKVARELNAEGLLPRSGRPWVSHRLAEAVGNPRAKAFLAETRQSAP